MEWIEEECGGGGVGDVMWSGLDEEKWSGAVQFGVVKCNVVWCGVV